MHDYALRLLSPQPGGLGNRKVNGAWVCIGDSVDDKSRCTRQGDVARPAVRFGPKDRFPVLRKPARREVRDTKDASGSSFDPLPLCQPRQHRVGESRFSSLLRSHEAVVLLSERDEFVETCAGHRPILAW